MHSELISTLIILLLCCVALTVLDLAVSGVVALVTGIKFMRVFVYGLLSLLLPVVLVAYGIAVERNCCKVINVELPFDDLPAAFDGYRLLQLSDIHSRSFIKRTRALQRMVDKANAQNADIILFTGDLVTIGPDELDFTAQVLRQLKADDGVMSVLGNHDYGIYGGGSHGGQVRPDYVRNLAERERAMGWDLLLNEHRIITRGQDSIAVVGVENTTSSRHFPSRGNLAQAMEGTDGMFHVLLSHDPMHWDMEASEKCQLTLSGHTHAIQFSLLGWCPSRYLFRQYRGLYSKAGHFLYVNIGLGETVFPARIGTVPEITVITLRCSR